jgi:aldehyde dehydrogenase (NAD+)
MVVGNPLDTSVTLGPMASEEHLGRVMDHIDRAKQSGARLVFGPVMAVIPFADDDDAVRIANDSNYGLGGSVWTKDEQRGIDLARRVRTGTIGVNYYVVDFGSPSAE